MKIQLALGLFFVGTALAQTPATPTRPAPQPAAPAPSQQTAAPAQPEQAQQPAAPVGRPSARLVANRKLRDDAPLTEEVYCNGLITKNSISPLAKIVGGKDSPQQTHYSAPEYIYLEGKNLQEGQEVSLLRHLKEPTLFEAYKGQNAELRSTGEAYQDLGRATVRYIRGNTAVAQVTFACADAVPGDLAIAFAERERPLYRHGPINTFDVPEKAQHGKIIMGQEFDYELGSGRFVYVNLGTKSGIKPGDYLRITREYNAVKDDATDKLSYLASEVEPTQKDRIERSPSDLARDLPTRTLGEAMVLRVTDVAATAITTLALDEIRPGDMVELEPDKPAPVVPQEAKPQPPTVSCTASPATIKVGESATVACDANSPDEHPLDIYFQTTAGQLAQRNNVATVSTAGVQPGPLTVTGVVTDDRNLTTRGTATVNVEAAPPAPAASKITELAFRVNSARVDNRAKAILDDIALRLQRETGSSVLLVGTINPTEKTALAAQRADNAKQYLVGEKGIDAARVQTRAASQKNGTKADVWIVPEGAAIPTTAF